MQMHVEKELSIMLKIIKTFADKLLHRAPKEPTVQLIDSDFKKIFDSDPISIPGGTPAQDFRGIATCSSVRGGCACKAALRYVV